MKKQQIARPVLELRDVVYFARQRGGNALGEDFRLVAEATEELLGEEHALGDAIAQRAAWVHLVYSTKVAS